MPKTLVLFYSRTGNTAILADAIAEGAKSVRFAEVDLRRIEDLAPEEVMERSPKWKESREALRRKYRTFTDVSSLAGYDGIILGSPSLDGIMAAELKHVLDQTEPLWSTGALVNKVGSAFTSVRTPPGGHETMLWSIMTPMASLGMILVPPGYANPAAFEGGSPHVAAAISGSGAPTEADLAVARAQGKRVATVVEWVTHARGHAHGHAHGHSH